jgi:RNA polymerase sigma factor (sigma-70 family)
MGDMNDMQLLEDYVSRNSQEAFAALVQRHVNLVFSVALRCVADPHKAQDVTQSVFLLLAQKASRLHKKTVLSGWLYHSARLTSATFRRGELRRQRREQEASMQSTLDVSTGEAGWEKLAPVLDDALGRLGEVERKAILLRYFEDRSVPEVALALGLKEPAARKRLVRALERLRSLFAKRGITVSAGALTAAITANAVQAAPAGLAATVSTAALAGVALQASGLFALTKIIAMTTLQKTTIATALALAAGTGIYALRQGLQWREQLQTLQQQQAPLAAQVQRLEQERSQLSEQLKAAVEASQANQNELIRLRGRGSRLRQLEQENAQLQAQRQELNRRLGAAQLAAIPSAEQAQAAHLTTRLETDLGMVELTNGIPARFDLGGGTNCVVVPRALPDGSILMEIKTEVTNTDGTASELDTSRLTAPPGQYGSISVGDRQIALRAKLK